MQYLDFRCRIVNYRTNEVDIAKLLEAIYDCKWDKHIHNSTMVGGYQVRYPYLEELCNNEMKKFMDEVLIDTVREYCMQECPTSPKLQTPQSRGQKIHFEMQSNLLGYS